MNRNFMTSSPSGTSEKDGKINKNETKREKGTSKQEANNSTASNSYSVKHQSNVALSADSIEPNINLSRDELLKLLSVFEGELQARDEVIAILKSECSQTTDMRYGLTSQPLKALRRDAVTLDMTSHDHVCEQTKEQLKKIIQHHKQSYKKLKEMHLSVEEKCQRLSSELEEEKRKHQEYMVKSDDFVNLIEHDRERLKQLFEQEKTTFVTKERELTRKLKENKDEVGRLKSLSLELVEDRQEQLQLNDDHKKLIGSLEKQVEELQVKLQEKDEKIRIEKDHALQLENELEELGNSFFNKQESWNIEIAEEKNKSKELEEKVKSLGRQMQKLKCVDKNLRKTDDQLWRIKEKLEQEEKYEDLLEEIELLRETVAGMQKAEQIYAQAQQGCDELRCALAKELAVIKSLREEFEKMRKSFRNKTEMERSVEEAMFRFDEMEQKYEAESKKQNKMKQQLEDYQIQLKKIDESEALLKFNEIKIRQLQTTVRDLKEEKSGLEARLQIEEDKSDQYKDMIEDEQNKVTKATQKAIEESKKVLKTKEELTKLDTKHTDKIKSLQSQLDSTKETMKEMITKEKAEQMDNLSAHLRRQLTILKKRLDQLEIESENKKKELELAKKEMEITRQNLNTSTTHLRRLVALGLETQLNESESKDPNNPVPKIQSKKIEDEVKSIGKHLSQNDTPGNENNNNNYYFKEVVMTQHVSTQTTANEAVEKYQSSRRLSRHGTLQGADSKPPPSRRASSLTRRDGPSERSRAPFKVGSAAPRRASSISAPKTKLERNTNTNGKETPAKMNCSSRDVKSHPLSSIDKNSSVKTISSQNTASRSKLEITHTEGESFENKKNFSLKLSKSPDHNLNCRTLSSPASGGKSLTKNTSRVREISKLYTNSNNSNNLRNCNKTGLASSKSNGHSPSSPTKKSKPFISTTSSSFSNSSRLARDKSNQSGQ